MHFYTVINLNFHYSTHKLLTTNLKETLVGRNTMPNTFRDVSADKKHQAEEFNVRRDLNAKEQRTTKYN